MSTSLTIGTRGSDLALYQARLVQRLLNEAQPEQESQLEIIKTTGDRDQRSALAKVAEVQQVEKGIFIKELEEALTEKRVDIAVHSLKDMPSELDETFELVAVLPRANTADVLVSKYAGGLAGLPIGATVATGAVRRQSQLRWLRPDLKLVEFRGNVPTRLEKTADNPEIDATMLAAAGLERLAYPVGGVFSSKAGIDLHLTILDQEEFMPAGGQGAIAIEALHSEAEPLKERLAPLCCRKTTMEVDAERAFLKELGAGCDTPVAVVAHAILSETQEWSVMMKARYWEESRTEPLMSEATGSNVTLVAQALVNGLK